MMEEITYWTVRILAEIGVFAIVFSALWIFTDIDALAVLSIDTAITFFASLILFREKLS